MKNKNKYTSTDEGMIKASTAIRKWMSKRNNIENKQLTELYFRIKIIRNISLLVNMIHPLAHFPFTDKRRRHARGQVQGRMSSFFTYGHLKSVFTHTHTSVHMLSCGIIVVYHKWKLRNILKLQVIDEQ